MTENTRATYVALVVALAAATSCHKNTTTDVAPVSSAAQKPAALPLSDTTIQAAVEQTLKRDPGVDASGLHVATTDGIVELTGTASNLLTKIRAARVAESVRGVRAVSDRTTVSNATRTDQQITADVKNALLNNAAADSYEVTVHVQSGKVTLTGAVQSYQESEMSRRLAEGVVGVKEVEDQLQVKHGVARSDAEVAADVTSRLRWDALVNDGLIEVAVHGGNVFLTGKVASAAEKRRAGVDAWVLGAANVDNTALKVDTTERDYLKHKLFTRTSSDIERAILAAVAYDPRVSAANLHVTVDDGRARLQGTVASVAARFAAEDVTRHTVGVISVQNDLSIKPVKQHSDADVQGAVRAALLWDPYTYSQAIAVKANAGKVTLTGTVRSRYERAEATDVAAGIEGVTDIDNALSIQREDIAYIFDSYVFPYGPYWETWRAIPNNAGHSDSEIKRAIHDELAWNPLLEANDVSVKVQHGHATLTGRVDSQSERIEATEEAYEGGAVAVDNRLVIANGE